jgi:hypothetical protein
LQIIQVFPVISSCILFAVPSAWAARVVSATCLIGASLWAVFGNRRRQRPDDTPETDTEHQPADAPPDKALRPARRTPPYEATAAAQGRTAPSPGRGCLRANRSAARRRALLRRRAIRSITDNTESIGED